MHYFCHECAVLDGTITPADPLRLTDNSYKLSKYLKHTVPTSLEAYTTFFSSPASLSYAHYVVTATSSGHVQVDDQGRTNIVWVASKDTGIAMKGGSYIGPTDAVKIVLPYDKAKIHAFPIVAAELRGAHCQKCGRPIPY